MPFESGKSGNPGGRSKSEKLFRDALSLAVKRTSGDKTMLGEIAEALVAKAMLGDVPAINAVADRLDGKPAQDVAIEHSGELTFKSAVISQLDSFFAQPAGPGLEDRSDENLVSN